MKDRLVKIRETEGYTQKEMADYLDVSLRSYSRYERENRDMPQKAFVKYAKLGINLNWLITGEGPMYRSELKKASGDAEGQVKDILTSYVSSQETQVAKELDKLIEQYKKLKNEGLSVAKNNKYREIINELDKIDQAKREKVINSILILIRNIGGRDE